MLPRLAADLTLVVHLAFIAFALLGAFLALRWRWVPLLQLPAAAWAIYVEASGRLCPLTHVENHYRQLAGQGGYAESFVERYLLHIIYPTALTREVQFMLAGVVILVNLTIYSFIALRSRRRACHCSHGPV
ncbi:MAG: DUF2784 domain-containing protein [Haliea sp.]|nr:MAG: DUF2784 domain-containing protein [Haliea sp.]